MQFRKQKNVSLMAADMRCDVASSSNVPRRLLKQTTPMAVEEERRYVFLFSMHSCIDWNIIQYKMHRVI